MDCGVYTDRICSEGNDVIIAANLLVFSPQSEFLFFIRFHYTQYTPTLQKPEGFRVKASEREVVVFYFEPSATQNLECSGFPEGETTWQNRHHPWNSPIEVSKNLSFLYDIGNNCGPLSKLCHVVYATKGYILPQTERLNSSFPQFIMGCPLIFPQPKAAAGHLSIDVYPASHRQLAEMDYRGRNYPIVALR